MIAAVESPALPQGLTLWDWGRAGIIMAVGVLASLVVKELMRRALHDDGSDRVIAELVGRIASYVATSAAFVYALDALHVQIGPLMGALGISGLAVALATQDLLANAFGGVLLETRRPFRRGDQIAAAGEEGVVEDVNLRNVVLRTFDGQRVFLPNTSVLRGPIVNHTVLRRRRTTLDVGLAYDTDLARTKRVALDAVRAVPGVLEEPPPEAFVHEFGESAIAMAVRWWHVPQYDDLWKIRDRVAVALKAAFDREGVVMPFPQRTVWLAGAGDVELDGARAEAPRSGRPPRDTARPPGNGRRR